jgi:hypothetical protein
LGQEHSRLPAVRALTLANGDLFLHPTIGDDLPKSLYGFVLFLNVPSSVVIVAVKGGAHHADRMSPPKFEIRDGRRVKVIDEQIADAEAILAGAERLIDELQTS